jgi:hypothetical protein
MIMLQQRKRSDALEDVIPLTIFRLGIMNRWTSDNTFTRLRGFDLQFENLHEASL